MKIYEIKEMNKPMADLANFFNIYTKEDGARYFSLLRSVFFTGTDEAYPFMFTKYLVQGGDAWTTLSYRFYGTIEYWWIICRFNDVSDPTSMPVAGTYLRIPVADLVNKVKNDMR